VLNYPVLLLAAIAAFAFGAAYYAVLGEAWRAAVGPVADARPRASALIIAFIAELVMAFMLAGVLLHLRQGGLALGLRTGLISAALLWLGFVATSLVVRDAFQGGRFLLTLIDGGHWLGVMLIEGAILAAWGVA
jgi:Protein of unknown function (DUF1761)